MRFLIAVLDTATGTATAEEMRAIDAFNAGLQARGELVLACGCAAPDASRVVDARAGATEPGAPIVTTGPANQSTEYMSGFWVVEAADADAAAALATGASAACNRRVELRALLG